MKNETEKMRELYDQWQTQGISKQAFCNQNGMGYHKFNYWVKKFRGKNVATRHRPWVQSDISSTTTGVAGSRPTGAGSNHVSIRSTYRAIRFS
jgi:hypothetical protein